MSVPASSFRDALATVATAVSVAATMDGRGLPRALTIGSLCSLSLTPPLVLFCLARTCHSHQVFCATSRFAVTVLAADQEDIARRLAGRRAGRTSVPLALMDGLPVVPGALAHMTCTITARLDGGDHTIIVGEVQQVTTRPGAPLLYYQRRYHSRLA